MRFHLLTPEIRELLTEGRHQDLVEVLLDMHPSDAASILAGLEIGEIATVLTALPEDFERDVFGYFEPELQEDYVTGAGRERVQEVLMALLSDDRAEFLERLDERVRKQLLPMLPQAAREDLLRRETFEDDQVGSILSTDYAVINPGATARSAIAQLRRQAPSKETIYYSYVLDRSGKLVGFVSLRDLILADEDAIVEDLMKTDLVSITAETDQEEAAHIINDYDLLALPVVDGLGNLVGIVTHDDAADIVEEEAQEDFEKMAGVTGHGVEVGDYDYMDEPVLRQVRRRAPVICLLALFGVSTSIIISAFEKPLESRLFVVMALLPIVLATGGMVGTQASALVIRAITTGDIDKGSIWRVLWKELRVAGSLALMLGGIAFINTMIVSRTKSPAPIFEAVSFAGFAIGVAMIGHVLTAALMGALTPLVVKKLRGDPAMISTPAVTAIVDLTGAAIYLIIVTLMLDPVPA